MTYAIIGSRSWKDPTIIIDKLNKHKDSITHVVSGGAKGPDSVGEEWAVQNKIECTIYKPDWEHYGRSAGMIRNTAIITNCDIVLAFWDGESRGTLDSIKKAVKLQKSVTVYIEKPHPYKIPTYKLPKGIIAKFV